MKTAKEWREFYNKPGAIATCESQEWLREGCPMCGHKIWDVTGDGWAYCKKCSKGYPTAYPFCPQGWVEVRDFTN